MAMNKNLTLIIASFFLAVIVICLAIFTYHARIVHDTAQAALLDAVGQQEKEKTTAQSQEPEFKPQLLHWQMVADPIPWSKRDSHAVAVYKNKIWVMGGLDANGYVIKPGVVAYEKAPYFSDVWSSQDGKNWELVNSNAPWQERRSIQAVEFKGKMWLMGGFGPRIGYQNDIWSSEDGINWKKESDSAAWPAREGHSLLVFKDALWLIGGVRYDKHKLFNDVWRSDDGIHWTQATGNAAWAPRWDHAVTVFDNKLWLIDGMVFNGKFFSEVWSSEDGVNWVLVNANPPFQSRQGNFITEYKGKLWVIGRLDGDLNGGANDVWYSDDGLHWQKTENDPLWTGREDFGAVIFQDKIWILGGMDENWTWKNDVWYSTF